MTIRAVILGTLLAALVAGTAFITTRFFSMTPIIGNLLPIGVFGFLVLFVTVINPLIRTTIGRGALRPTEMAIIIMMGLAVCGWPDSGFFRTFVGSTVMPAQLVKNEASWQAAGVMSYVPGGSPRLAPGQVLDYPRFAQTLAELGKESPEHPLWTMLLEAEPALPRTLERIAATTIVPTDLRNRLLAAVNTVIEPGGEPTAEDLLVYRLHGNDLPSHLADAAARRDDWRQPLPDLTARLVELQTRKAVEEEKIAEELSAARAEETALQAQVAELKIAYDTAWLANDKARARGDDTAELRQALDDAAAKLAAAESGMRAVQERIEKMLAPVYLVDRDIMLVNRDIALAERQARRAELVMNRLTIDARFPELIQPYPRGEGVLVLGGDADPSVVEALQYGFTGPGELGLPWVSRPSVLPWKAWWPTLRLWGGMAICIGLASLCLALIVHPQWSRRELLAYPIARFVAEITERHPTLPGAAIFRSRLFWIGFGAVVTLHLINGLDAWFPASFDIPMKPDFNPLKTLFPYASRAPGNNYLFNPTLYLTVIGFAFFLSAEVSFSLGISGVLWVAFGAFLIRSGVPVMDGYATENMGPMLRFGAYMGLLLTILYTGRRYYANVVLSTLGGPRGKETPVYAVWAARLLIVTLLGAIWLMTRYGGVDWMLATLGVFFIMLTLLVISRVSAETGLLIMQPVWMPVSVLTAFFGMQGMGPTGYIAIALMSIVIVGDPREAIMPYLTNALRIGEESGDARPTRTWPVLTFVIVAGFIFTLYVTLGLQYDHGASLKDAWATRSLPNIPFRQMADGISRLDARGELTQAVTATGLGRFDVAKPNTEAVGWAAVGLALVLGCAFARLRLPWWPLHPVAFLIWGSYFGMQFSIAFLVGWAIKGSVVRLAGAKGYQTVKPLMVGVIAGEILAALLWLVIGGIYAASTGQNPASYVILPA